MAISAIDIALWDLRARQRGVSLARLLGQVRDRVPCYGSGKASPTLPLDELVAASASYIQNGFRAVKIRIGREPEHDLDRVKAVPRPSAAMRASCVTRTSVWTYRLRSGSAASLRIWIFIGWKNRCCRRISRVISGCALPCPWRSPWESMSTPDATSSRTFAREQPTCCNRICVWWAALRDHAHRTYR